MIEEKCMILGEDDLLDTAADGLIFKDEIEKKIASTSVVFFRDNVIKNRFGITGRVLKESTRKDIVDLAERYLKISALIDDMRRKR